MKKNWLWIFFFSSCLSIGLWSAGLSQEKEKEKKRETGIALTAESLTVTKDKGGLVISRSWKESDDDFLVEPKKYINVQIDLLEIKPSKTLMLTNPRIRIENGHTGSLVQGTQTPPNNIAINIVPAIVEGKGIDLKVEFIKEPEMKEKKEEKIFLKNAESAVVELFENKAKESKIAIRITPFVEVVDAAKEYPRPISEVRLNDSFLLLNEDKLIAQGSLNATSDADDIYLFFNCDGKGLFVLSFKPFEGAEPKGVVKGKILRIKFGEDEFKWMCREPILPEGKWLVWVRHNPNLKQITIGKGREGILGKNGLIGIGTGKDDWKPFFKLGSAE